jgi:hypothetical protein
MYCRCTSATEITWELCMSGSFERQSNKLILAKLQSRCAISRKPSGWAWSIHCNALGVACRQPVRNSKEEVLVKGVEAGLVEPCLGV